MSISVAPTNLLPLGDQPTRISVRIDQALLKSIDPCMEPLVEGDSHSRVRRKGKAAINQMARDVSMALFGAEIPPLEMSWGWPNHIKRPDGLGYIKAGDYTGIVFDHHVSADNPSPRVMGLTADEELDGVVVFHAKVLDAERSDFMNKATLEGLQNRAGFDLPGVSRPML